MVSEEQEDWEEETEDESPAKPSPGTARFTLRRLIFATAVAPLPLLFVDLGADQQGGWLVVSCVALFAATLLITPSELPSLNMGISILAIVAAFICALSVSGAATGIALFVALPALLIAACCFPPIAKKQFQEWRCDSVIYTSLPIYFLLNLAFLAVVYDSLSRGDFLIGIVAVGGMVLLLGVNLAWIITRPQPTLRQRPDLGYWYEATMVLIPTALLFWLVRYVDLQRL